MEEAKSTIKFLSENSGTISVASVVSAGSIIFGWIKLYSKLISEPFKNLGTKVDLLSIKTGQENSINENRFKEFDRYFEDQEDRIASLESEDKQVIKNLQITRSKLEELTTNFGNHKEKFGEVLIALKELQNLDTQRQVAVGRVQTLLEVFVGKSQ